MQDMSIDLKPYLIRAIYEWISDNDLTPQILVDATKFGVIVPKEHIKNGQIVLNISEKATGALVISNEIIEFFARFSGISRKITIPIGAVLGIYARENGAGTAFMDNDLEKKETEQNKKANLVFADSLQEAATKTPKLEEVEIKEESSDEANTESNKKPSTSKKASSQLKIIK